MNFQQPAQQQPNQQQINQHQQQPDQNIQPNPMVDQPPKNIRKIAVLIILGVLILGGVSYGAYYWWPKNNKPVACTQEAKQCPDGSYVSRTGPNCEFALCPKAKADETAGWQTYRNEEHGFEVKYPKGWYLDNTTLPISFSNYPYSSQYTPGDMPDDLKSIFIERRDVKINDNYDSIKPSSNESFQLLSWESFYSQYSVEGRVSVINSHEHPTGQHTEVLFLDHKGHVIRFSLGTGSEDVKDVLIQILSTFKFTK